jgi:hypothetical protein
VPLPKTLTLLRAKTCVMGMRMDDGSSSPTLWRLREASE